LQSNGSLALKRAITSKTELSLSLSLKLVLILDLAVNRVEGVYAGALGSLLFVFRSEGCLFHQTRTQMIAIRSRRPGGTTHHYRDPHSEYLQT
jgi:hypothetical protein